MGNSLQLGFVSLSTHHPLINVVDFCCMMPMASKWRDEYQCETLSVGLAEDRPSYLPVF